MCYRGKGEHQLVGEALRGDWLGSHFGWGATYRRLVTVCGVKKKNIVKYVYLRVKLPKFIFKICHCYNYL